MKKYHTPPKLVHRFLRWFCPNELLEGIEGDIAERFEEDIDRDGIQKANINYLKNVMAFFRPAIVARNKFVIDLIPAGMIRSYFTISWRYLSKNKTFSAINIVGLAFGMAAALLVYEFVSFEKSYDRFHQNGDQIFRVTTEWNKEVTPNDQRATTIAWSGPGVKEAFPEVIDYARFAPIDIFTGANAVRYKDVKIPEQRIFLADPSFFKIFSFPFLSGDPVTALVDPGSIVITASIAEKYFKGEDPMGKFLFIDTHGNVTERESDMYKITGVVKDPPANSHLTFDFLLSFNMIYSDFHSGSMYWHWDYTYCYLLLHPNANVDELEKKMSTLRVKEFGKDMQHFKDVIDFNLQPLNDIHLYSSLHGEISANSDGRTLSFLIAVGICILACAYINYVNLSTVKAVERKTEIGIRKVVGSTKIQLVIQLLVEAFVLNGAALLFAILIFRLSVPVIESAFNIRWPEFDFSFFDGNFFVIASGIFASGILLSVLYPAFVLSRFRPAVALKGGHHLQGTRGMSLRHSLIVLQFVFCIVFALGTYSLFRQQQFMLNYDLGMNLNRVLAVKGYGFQSYQVYENFRDQLATSPNVESVGTATTTPGDEIIDLSFNRIVSITGKEPAEKRLKMILVDEHFFNTLKVQLLAGRSFNPATAEKNVAMLNEAAAKLLGFDDPSQIINESVTAIAAVDPKIIGVIKNYNQRSLKNDFDPIIFLPMKDNDYSWNKRYFFVRFTDAQSPEDFAGYITAVEKVWKDVNPDKPFQYFFADSYFEHQYASDKTATSLFLFFASFVIFIACLGLFGMVAYTTLQRTKEIGVRKVMGASVNDILALLSKDFLKLISISTLIGVPVVVAGIQMWLQQYSFRIEITVWLLMLPLVCIFAIAMATVIFRSRKVAVSNPVDSLRYE
jgi:putative ABC transport system permease protein